MHEDGLVKSLLGQVARLASEHAATGVEMVKVRVGAFSGVEPELLQSAFERRAPRTIAQGARLIVERVPLRAACQNCQQTFPIEQYHFVCTFCQSAELHVIEGEELLLESVTLEHAS